MSRRMMYVRTRSPTTERGGGAPLGAPPPSARLLLDPPLVDVVSNYVGCRREILDARIDRREGVRPEAKVVGLLVVQDLGDGVVRLLARRDRAITVRGVSPVDDRLIERVVLVEREAECLLAGAGDLVGVPDAVRVRVALQARPPDADRFDLGVGGNELVDDALEGLGLRLRL